ncbi:MAG: hypothetical protein OEM39_04835 [Acidimicrobiia bacterium]|nr:hypothetical protein [Acidimicrobiia bacterium]MDH3462568.1 hypothetical protein [Acidimicrobiia bacterium]
MPSRGLSPALVQFLITVFIVGGKVANKGFVAGGTLTEGGAGNGRVGIFEYLDTLSRFSFVFQGSRRFEWNLGLVDRSF